MRTSVRGRRGIVGLVAVCAAVVSLAGTAFACISYRGTLTVTAASGSTGEVTAVGDCGAHTHWGAPVGVLTVAAGLPAGAASVNVSVAPSPVQQCNPNYGSPGPNQLPDTVTIGATTYTVPYAITFVNGPSYTGHVLESIYSPPMGWSCINYDNNPPPVKTIGSISSLSAGTGSASNVALPANLTADSIGTESSLCVSSKTIYKGGSSPQIVLDAGYWGNSVPISVAVV